MHKEKLIVALDVPGASEARSIVSELRDQVGAFKIGLQLFAAAGPSIVSELTQSGVRIFLDLKFHDIPNTVAKASLEATKLGVWMFNLHAMGGSEMMRRAHDDVLELCDKENLKRPLIIGVTVLTSSDDLTLREVGIGLPVKNQVVSLALLAEKCGLDGVVASSLECRVLRSSGVGDNFKIITPGVRPISATNDDQKRVTTPGDALEAGADYIVVGRPILQAADRSKAVEELLTELEPVHK